MGQTTLRSLITKGQESIAIAKRDGVNRPRFRAASEQAYMFIIQTFIVMMIMQVLYFTERGISNDAHSDRTEC